MSAHRRDILLLAALTAAVVTSAWGQTVAPAPGPAGGVPQGAASHPDFSGVWTHPYWPGFDPPLSGPGPVVNKSRLPSGAGNSNQLVGDYANPILKPQAAEVVRKHGEISLAGVTYPTPANQCWPQPVPYIFWTIGIQMLQQPDKVTILYSNPNHEVRHVRLNQPHPAQVTPSWYGDSVGHYEGDTLVVDTVGIKTGRPFAMVDIYGTPYTEALHVVERYRLVDYDAVKEAQERDAEGEYPHPPQRLRPHRRPRLSGQGAAAPIHGRGPGRFHHAVVGDHDLSARPGRLAGIRLCREHS